MSSITGLYIKLVTLLTPGEYFIRLLSVMGLVSGVAMGLPLNAAVSVPNLSGPPPNILPVWLIRSASYLEAAILASTFTLSLIWLETFALNPAFTKSELITTPVSLYKFPDKWYVVLSVPPEKEIFN